MAGILLRGSSLAAAAADHSASAAELATAEQHASVLESAPRRGSSRDCEQTNFKAVAAGISMTPSQRSFKDLDQDFDQDLADDDDASECGSSRSGSPTVSDASSIRWAPQRNSTPNAGRRRSVDSSMSSV